MNRVFCHGKEKIAARYEYRARVLTLTRRKRHSNQALYKVQEILNELQSFQRGLLRFEQRCENLVVLVYSLPLY